MGSGNQAVKSVKSSAKKSPKKEKKPKTPEPELDLVDFGLGDTVRLRKGREGVIKYYNPSKSKVVGIELSAWSADASDGSHKGKKYFECDSGRGYFTTAKAVSEVLKRAS